MRAWRNPSPPAVVAKEAWSQASAGKGPVHNASKQFLTAVSKVSMAEPRHVDGVTRVAYTTLQKDAQWRSNRSPAWGSGNSAMAARSGPLSTRSATVCCSQKATPPIPNNMRHVVGLPCPRSLQRRLQGKGEK